MKDALLNPLRAVEQDLRRVEEHLLELLQRRGGAVRVPGERIFRSGGKRLRPVLVLLTSRLLGPQPPEAVPIAAAVEMVHGASLLHDDVIDETRFRRGRPTVNTTLGNRYTVLLGDFLLTQALEAVCRVGRVQLVRVVSEAVAEMTLGQIMELEHQGDLETGVEEYLRIIDGKTASLMAAGCMLGGLLAGVAEEGVEALGIYGRSVGMAFQIVDDVLDYWGDPEVLGKPVGSDFSEGKFTLPFLVALERAGPAERSRFRDLASHDRLGPTDFREVLAMMEGLGAREGSLDLARGYVARALEEVARLPSGAARDYLAEVPGFIMSRDH